MRDAREQSDKWEIKMIWARQWTASSKLRALRNALRLPLTVAMSRGAL